MSHSSPAGPRRRAPDPRLPVRACRLLRVRAIWPAPQRLEVGRQIEAGPLAAPAVTNRLHLEVTTLSQAEHPSSPSSPSSPSRRRQPRRPTARNRPLARPAPDDPGLS